MYKRKSWITRRRKTLRPSYQTSHDIYNQHDVNDLIKDTPLSLGIGKILALRKSGKQYYGYCPFCKSISTHNRQFAVSDNRKKWKCFSCGIGGTNIIGFLKLYYTIPFNRALSWIIKNIHPDRHMPRIERTVNHPRNEIRDSTGEVLPF